MPKPKALNPLNIWTIRRLNALGPGQTMIYYCGDIDANLKACDSDRDDFGAPSYKVMLQAIRNAALALEAAGCIKLTQRVVPRRHRFTDRLIMVMEYIAEGV